MQKQETQPIVASGSISDDVSAALKEHSELIKKNEELIKSQGETISGLEKSMSDSSDAVNKLVGKVDGLQEEVNKILSLIREIQVSP